MRAFLAHLARWPLLLGGIICLTGGLILADSAGYGALVVGVLLALGSLLMGAWLWGMATHTSPDPRPADPAETNGPDTPIPPRS